MDPVSVPSFTPPQVQGSSFTRGLSAVFLERRLPHRLARLRDHACIAVGASCKSISVASWSFRVRRLGVDEDVLRNVILTQEYHPPGYEIGPADTVIDIGGNIGAFAVPAAAVAQRGRVFSYEPDERNHCLLSENLRRNGCQNARAVRQAVTGHGGPVRFLSDSNSSGHRVEAGDGPGERVESVKLADIFDRHQIEACDFLKLDCEGAEYEILSTLPHEYWQRTRRIALEYHAEPESKRQRADELIRRFRESGFRIDRYTDVIGEPVGHLFATRVG
jgi:FkbM family methyltransferase